MPRLGVNIDHIATLRQARRCCEPDPVRAALLCEQAGADAIVAHLREDRRHIQDQDIRRLRAAVTTRLNLEMAIAPSVVRTALAVRPDQATLVPERRRELTTEGGLDVVTQRRRLAPVIRRLQRHGIVVSLFVDPAPRQVNASAALGVEAIELHTGAYAGARTTRQRTLRLTALRAAAAQAQRLGLMVHAGHGLDYRNVGPVARIPGLGELNIGFSIIGCAAFVGLPQAVRRMKALMR